MRLKALHDDESRDSHLNPLIVHLEHQGQGIGRALALELERLARERGGMTIYLGTDDLDNCTNLGGIDLYPDIATHIKKIQIPEARRGELRAYGVMKLWGE